MEADDGFFLRRLQTEMLGHPTAVLIHPPLALPPGVELAQGNAPPRNEAADSDLGLLRPASDEIDHDPALRAESKSRSEFPRLFLNAMCSAISSARISSLVRTFFPKNSIRFCFSSARRPGSSVVWRAADEWCEEKAIVQNCRKCVFHRKAASTGQKALTLRHIER